MNHFRNVCISSVWNQTSCSLLSFPGSYFLVSWQSWKLFISFFSFSPFSLFLQEEKIHWLCLVLLFSPSLLPLFQTCQVSNVFLLVHWVWSKDGLMNTGLQCSWFTLADRSMETGSPHCLQSLPGYLQIHIRTISWLFPQSERLLWRSFLLCKQIPQWAF